MYFYAIITGTEYDLQYPYPEVSEFLCEFTKQPAVKRFWLSEEKAREAMNASFHTYGIKHTIRLREFEEVEMTLASQIIEAYEYELNGSTLRTQLVKFKTWDD